MKKLNTRKRMKKMDKIVISHHDFKHSSSWSIVYMLEMLSNEGLPFDNINNEAKAFSTRKK